MSCFVKNLNFWLNSLLKTSIYFFGLLKLPDLGEDEWRPTNLENENIAKKVMIRHTRLTSHNSDNEEYPFLKQIPPYE